MGFRSVAFDFIAWCLGYNAFAIMLWSPGQYARSLDTAKDDNKISALSSSAETPPIVADAKGDQDLCLLRLKSGENAALRNSDGMSASDVAHKNGFERVAKSIRETAS